jgi:hypothetical protein
MGRPLARGGPDIPPPEQRLCTIHGIPIPPAAWKRGYHRSSCKECYKTPQAAIKHELSPEGIERQKENGRKILESGQLALIRPLGGLVATHKRWHVARNVVNPKCLLCMGFSAADLYADIK